MELTLIKEDIENKFEQELKKQLKSLKFKDSVAVKLHMGEGFYHFDLNLTKIAVKVLKELKAKPFLIDTITSYNGLRATPEKYFETAKSHGFSEESIGCPIIIPEEFVNIKTEHLNVEVSKPIHDASALLVLTHFKGHECCGAGGSIKNLGMGAVTKKTKENIHEGARPVLTGMYSCKGCKICFEHCPNNAINMYENKPSFNYESCEGCDICIDSCPNKCLSPKIAKFNNLLAEGASAVIKNKKKIFYVNDIRNITRHCDCYKNPGKIIAPDIGVLMGKDIVAIDKASADLVNDRAGLNIFLKENKTNPYGHIYIAEELGMGNSDYKITPI